MTRIKGLAGKNSERPVPANGKVALRRPPLRRRDARPRKHLTPSEVQRLMDATRKSGRYALRDRTAVMVCYRHGLRVSELTSLQWSQVDLVGATVTVPRSKGGVPTIHPLRSIELRALGQLRKASPAAAYVFMSERGAPLTAANFRMILRRLARVAKLPVSVNPHALRHACGYKLAADGVDTRALSHYLGHRSLSSTERYTAQSPSRFRDFFRD